MKTELLRTTKSVEWVYTIDQITPKTLISGKVVKDEETGEMVPVAGILPQLDAKTLVIKDFTQILRTREENRTEVFGQLRSAHDGYLEMGFGTLKEPIRVKSSFGLLRARRHMRIQ